MGYVIIEKLPLGLVLDEEGNPMIFDTMDEAEKEADECQEPVIVDIGSIYG